MTKMIKTLCFIALSISFAACDNRNSKQSQDESAAAQSLNVNEQSKKDTTDVTSQKGEYTVKITMNAFGTDQVMVFDHVDLPKNEATFCQNRDLMQSNLPEGSTIQSCEFSGSVGQATFLFKIDDQNIQTTAKYEFQPMQ